MHAEIVCPGCQRSYAFTDKVRGKTVRCPSCSTKFTVPAEEPPPPAEEPGIPQTVAYTEESPQEEIVYMAEEVPAEPEEAAVAVSPAGRERQADAAEGDDAGWVLPAEKVPIPASVRVGLIAFALLLVSDLATCFLIYTTSASPTAGVIALAIVLPIIGLLFVGTWAGNRLAWQWCRILAPLGGILAALGAAFAILTLTQLAAKVPGDLVRSAWLVLVIRTSDVIGLFTIFYVMGQPSARQYFGLMCPECGSFRCRPEDFWFRLVHCRSCRNEWTEAPTALKGRLDDRADFPSGKAGAKARRRKRPAGTPRSRARVWVGVTAALLGVALLTGVGYVAVTRLLPVFRPGIDAAAWRDYASPGGNFKAEMPGTPKYTRQVQQVGADRLQVHTHEVQVGWPETSFSVSYSDYPPHVIQRIPVEARLDGSRDGAVKGIEGKLRHEKRLSLNSFPGRELEIEVPGKGTVMMRLYAVHQRIFILGVGGPWVKADSPDVKRFFDSFQLQSASPPPNQVAGQPRAPVQPNRPNPMPVRPSQSKPVAPPQPAEPPPPPYQPTPVQPVVIKPPSLSGDTVTVPLPGRVETVAVGGGGRYLILYLRTARRLAVFDANEAKVVREIPMPEFQVFLAAGMDKLMVVLPQSRQLVRYSLSTFQQEATVPLPIKDRCTGIALGSASNGPLLIDSAAVRGIGEMCFFDIVAMRKVGITTRTAAPGGIGPRARLHAAADGSVFTAANQSYVVKGSALDAYQVPGAADLLPGPDGRTLYASGQIFTAEGKAFGPNVSGHGHAVWYVPALHGPHFVSLNEERESPLAGRPGGRQFLSLGVHLAGDRRPLVTLPKLDALEGLVNWLSGIPQPLDQHVFLIPDAQLLAVLPQAKDRLILKRFDLLQMLETAGVDYLFVNSQPPAQSRRGTPFAYQMTVRSKKGGVRYKLESGPPGMTLSPAGLLRWDVPDNFAPAEVQVIIAVSDATDQEVYHTFMITVTDKG